MNGKRVGSYGCEHQSQRGQSDQFGGADRYYLRCGRVGVPCPWSHCEVRASADFPTHKRRVGPRLKARAKPWPPAIATKTIPALQDLVAARKSVSQAERHFGIGRSTAYKAIRNAMQCPIFVLCSSLAWFYEQTFRWGHPGLRGTVRGHKWP